MADITENLVTTWTLDISKALANIDKATESLKSVDKQMGDLNSHVGKMESTFSGLVGGLTKLAAGFGVFKLLEAGIGMIKDAAVAIHNMAGEVDGLNDASEQLGITTDQFQGLQAAAILGGTGVEKLKSALTSLATKMGDVDEGTSEAAKRLRAFGVSGADSPYDAIMKLADGFANAESQAAKLRVSAQLFGKAAGPEMAQFLSQGSAAIAQYIQKAQDMGAIIGPDAVRAAAEYRDNLERLSLNLKALGNTIFSYVIGPLSKLTDELVRNIKMWGLWGGTVQTVLDKIFGSDTQNFRKQAEQLEKNIDGVSKKLQELSSKGLNADNSVGYKNLIDAQQKLRGELSKTQIKLAELAEQRKQTDWQPMAASVTVAADAFGHLGNNAKGAKEKVEEADKAWKDWIKTLEKSIESTSNAPRQAAYLVDKLNELSDAGLKGSKAWDLYLGELKKVAPELHDMVTEVDPVTKAMNALGDETAKYYSTLSQSQSVITGITARMEALAAAGKQASKEYQILADKKMELEGFADPVVKAANEVKKSMEDARKASSDLIEAFGRGLLTEAELLGKINESAKKAATTATFTAESFIKAGESFTSGFVDKWIDGLGKAEQSFSDFLTDLTKMIAKWITNAVVQKFFTSLVNAYGGAIGFAKGGAWNESGVQMLAKGGLIFPPIPAPKVNVVVNLPKQPPPKIEFMAQGGILNSPTMFRSGNRLAVAGEAGPEAVVPLQRTPSGDLGVSASPVQVNVYNQTGGAAEVRTATVDNADGSRQIEVYVKNAVRTMFSSGQMDRTMASSYGLTRQAR